MRPFAAGLVRRALGILLALASLPAFAQFDAPPPPAGPLQVSVLTFGPGEIYWERFGHNAIVIRDRERGTARSYNYGMFDFADDDFLLNFARGAMRYRMAADDPEEDIAFYASEGRFVVEQVLALDTGQARRLQEFLETNLRPENRYYRYDYFRANCSTKVRDALDQALDGALRKQLTAPSRGYTYRLLADALMAPQPALMAGIDLGLGPFADQRLSFWDDSFVPMQLMDHLREIRLRDAAGVERPLVASETTLAPARLAPPPALPPDWRLPALFAGCAVSGLMLVLARRKAKATRLALALLGGGAALIAGIIGVILTSLWALTAHEAGWANENLWIFPPLCLGLLPAWWRSRRPDALPAPWASRLALVIALMAGFALFSKILPAFAQANLAWIVLMLPIHLASAWILRRRA